MATQFIVLFFMTFLRLAASIKVGALRTILCSSRFLNCDGILRYRLRREAVSPAEVIMTEAPDRDRQPILEGMSPPRIGTGDSKETGTPE